MVVPMPVAKLSVSFTEELASTVRDLSERRGEDLSRLLEILLREHPDVARAVRERRERRKERAPEELRMLARAARRLWEERVESGRVRVLGPRR